MKEETTKEKKNYNLFGRILTCIGGFLVVFILVVGIWGTKPGDMKFYTASQVIKNEWHVRWGGNEYIGKLPANIKNETCEKVQISMVLDDHESYEYIMFYSIQANVKVFLDEMLLLNFEKVLDPFIQFLPQSGYHVVKLPEEFYGKTLIIEIEPTLKQASGILPTVYTGDTASFIYTIVNQALPQIILCVPLFVVAILLFIIGAYFIIKVKKKRQYAMLFWNSGR